MRDERVLALVVWLTRVALGCAIITLFGWAADRSIGPLILVYLLIEIIYESVSALVHRRRRRKRRG